QEIYARGSTPPVKTLRLGCDLDYPSDLGLRLAPNPHEMRPTRDLLASEAPSRPGCGATCDWRTCFHRLTPPTSRHCAGLQFTLVLLPSAPPSPTPPFPATSRHLPSL